MYLYYIGGVNVFSNPSSIIVFGKDSVNRTRFTVIIDDAVKPNQYVSVHH